MFPGYERSDSSNLFLETLATVHTDWFVKERLSSVRSTLIGLSKKHLLIDIFFSTFLLYQTNFVRCPSRLCLKVSDAWPTFSLLSFFAKEAALSFNYFCYKHGSMRPQISCISLHMSLPYYTNRSVKWKSNPEVHFKSTGTERKSPQNLVLSQYCTQCSKQLFRPATAPQPKRRPVSQFKPTVARQSAKVAMNAPAKKRARAENHARHQASEPEDSEQTAVRSQEHGEAGEKTIAISQSKPTVARQSAKRAINAPAKKRVRTQNQARQKASEPEDSERTAARSQEQREAGEKTRAWPLQRAQVRDLREDESNPALFLQSKHKHQQLAAKGSQMGTMEELFGLGGQKGNKSAIMTWAELGLSEYLVRALQEGLKIERPTRVQCLAVPAILTGRDVLLKSQTGSGKTLAFLVPVVERLSKLGVALSRQDGCRALILAPTRELALQIYKVVSSVVQRVFHGRLIPGVVMGGEKKKAEKARLRKGVPLLVATPGRVLDHLQHTQAFELSALRFLVLDEADRLLDLGFEKDIKEILQLLDLKRGKAQERRQTVLVSATLQHKDTWEQKQLTASGRGQSERDEQEAATTYVKEDERKEEMHRLPSSLIQEYVEVQSRHRMVALASFLRLQIFLKDRGLDYKSGKGANVVAKERRVLKAVVFLSTIASVELHHRLFSQAVWPDPAAQLDNSHGANVHHDPPADKQQASPLLEVPLWKLHGDLPQKERTDTYLRFAKAAGGILLCTDVAARGLDLPAVDYILQFDPPEQCQEYIHRVGRTARMGREGKAVLFLLPSELEYLKELEKHFIRLLPVPLPSVLNGLKTPSILAKPRQPNGPVTNLARLREMPGVVLQRQFFRRVSEDPETLLLAQQAYLAYTRAYTTYPRSLKAIFHPKRLHLGHVAKGFALQQKPTEVAKVVKKKKSKADQNKKGGVKIKSGDLEAVSSKQKQSIEADITSSNSNSAKGSKINYRAKSLHSRLANAEFG
eukprot:g19175.t1